MVHTLAGVDVPVERFTHANMTPFYRGSAPKQSMRQNGGAQSLLEVYTGQVTGRPRPAKREQGPLFPQQRQNVYGNQVTTGAQLAAIQPSRIRSNELPFQQVREAPGVRGGETGDTLYDARAALLPNNVARKL